MALPTDQLNAITSQRFVPKLIDNIFDSNPQLERARRKSLLKFDGGSYIQMPLNYAQTSAAGWYSGLDTLDTTDNESITAAIYQWKFSYANITIKGTDELKNSGMNQEVDLVKSKTQIAEKTLADIIGTAMWNTGTTAVNMHGLRYLLNTTGTIGGIDAATYSWWQSNLSSATVVTMPTLNGGLQNATYGSDIPTVGYSTRSIYNLFYALLQPQQRFMDADTAKAGFSSLMINGIPLIVDSHTPAGYLAFLNEEHIKFVVHTKRNFVFSPFVTPTNQDARVGKIYFAGNYCTDNNKRHALFTALAS